MTKINKQTIQILINYYKSNDLAKLEQKSRTLLKTFPKEMFLYNMLGISLVGQKKYPESISTFKNALKIEPQNAEMFCNLGNACSAKRDHSSAIENYEKAIKIKPEYSQAYYNLGNALKDQFKFAQAAKNYEKAIKIKADYAESYCNLGNIKKFQGKFSDAENHYKKALEINPKYKAAYINLSFLQLSTMNFKKGWESHEGRVEVQVLKKELKLKKDKMWNGSKFKGTLMVIGEQGLGDYVLFGSMLKDLIKAHEKITLMINERLLSLFERSFPKINFIKFDSNIHKYNYEKYVFMGSLGKYFRKNLQSFPKNQNSFLIPDKKNVQQFRKRLSNSKMKKIGLSWKTDSFNNKEERSINLINFKSIFKVNDFRLINLQYGNTQNERFKLKNATGSELIHFNDVDYTNDIEKITALVSQCDIVVTIANFTAQLSASLGVPTWVLLPYSCHWRWFVKRVDSPWYPSVRLFRQKKWGDWESTIREVTDKITKL